MARDSSTGKRISISNIVFISLGIFLPKIIFFRYRSPVVLRSINVSTEVQSGTTQFITNMAGFGRLMMAQKMGGN